MSTVMVPPGSPNPMDPRTWPGGSPFPPLTPPKSPDGEEKFPTIPRDKMIICFPTDLPIEKNVHTDCGWRRPWDNGMTDCWEIPDPRRLDPGKLKFNPVNAQATRFPEGRLQVTNQPMRAQVESFDFNSNKKLAMGDRMMESSLRARP